MAFLQIVEVEDSCGISPLIDSHLVVQERLLQLLQAPPCSALAAHTAELVVVIVLQRLGVINDEEVCSELAHVSVKRSEDMLVELDIGPVEGEDCGL